MTGDPSPADSWSELLEAVRHPDKEGWARTLEPAVVLAAVDPVLSRLFVEATWDEIRVSQDYPVDDEGTLPYLWPEAAGFELRHSTTRRVDEYGDDVYVIVRHPPPEDPSTAAVSSDLTVVSAPLPRARLLEEWDDLRRRWDAETLADPRFWVIDPAAAEPLGRHLTPNDAVTLWSAAVARTMALGD